MVYEIDIDKLKSSEESMEKLAYWIGVVQTDGCLSLYKETVQISFRVCEKSLPMLVKFNEFSYNLFGKKSNMWKEKTRDLFDYHFCVKSILHIFERLGIRFGDPPKPPEWCLDDPALFGAYFAGVLDGDGCIWLTKPKDYKGLVCRAKVTSGSPQIDLQKAIKKFLNCQTRMIKVHTDGYIRGSKIIGDGYNLEFIISSKNHIFAKEFILPYLTISHKYQRLNMYIEYINGHHGVNG